MIRVVHCTGSLEPKSGGPARIVTGLTDSLSVEGSCSVILLSQNSRSGSVIAASPESQVERRIETSSSIIAIRGGWPLRRSIRAIIHEVGPALFHDHGIWMPNNHYVAVAARKFGIPLVIHPHGTLEPWALQYRGWKKRLALRLYQQEDLETVALFFANSEQEAEGIRRLGLKQPIAIIPNGVEIFEPRLDRDARRREKQQTQCAALFLGRIHPVKGLLNLIEAWSRIRPKTWRLCIAGPDEGGHLVEVMRRVRSLDLEGVVDYVGEVEGEEKAALYERANLFVLPSFSENFGVVVAEAMAYGIPVITTHGTPWAGLLHHGCGWWVEPTVDALVVALQEAMEMDLVDLQAMGQKGRQYAREFDWAIIARKTVDVYRWILGQGSIPRCVVRT
jgi:glycosyltransferase involved in cell wall biosynthesis